MRKNQVPSCLILILLLFLPAMIAPLPGQAPSQEEATAPDADQAETEVMEDEKNPFETAGSGVDIWRAIGLMKDFKISSLILLLVMLVPAVVICRRYLHKNLPDSPYVTVLAATFIYYLLFLIVNFGLYWLAVHYGWMGFSDLNTAVNSSELWPQIQKTWSLGLGSFYVAHVIDAFIAAVLLFPATVALIALFLGKFKPRG